METYFSNPDLNALANRIADVPPGDMVLNVLATVAVLWVSYVVYKVSSRFLAYAIELAIRGVVKAFNSLVHVVDTGLAKLGWPE